ncbi:hypothetical protein GCM10009745_68760 [Kribbella yunnanensis]|uniref:DUF3800 domain-containing protein n=1 Tax=Kribbella yunnanensis TaxID=190194 RepID=A0ABP4UX46_9ACTN
MTPPTVRLFYVDDSGSEQTGWAVYSWIECTAAAWRDGLRDWLELRRRLYREHQIPADYELHASKFIGGRGNPSLDPAWNRAKHLRGLAAEQALTAISSSPGLRVGTVYRRGTGKGHEHASAAEDLYRAMVDRIDERLRKAGDFGLIFMDGDGSDSSYYRPHRALQLNHRHVIEDPLFQDSRRSQWVQMADLVAYAAYIHLLRPPSKEFAWHWYERHLQNKDVNAGPIEM